MKWVVADKGSPICYIGCSENTSIKVAAQELWKKYLEDAAPKNADLFWDYLGVYVYLDSGRVILYPVVQASRWRVEKAMCQIVCSDLLASFEEAADGMMSERELEAWATAAIAKVIDFVSDAAKLADIPRLVGRSEVRILYYSFDGDSGPIREEVLKTV